MIKNIEMAYIRLRAERIPEFEQKLVEIKQGGSNLTDMGKDVGRLMFVFRDTYGLTIETMQMPVLAVFSGKDAHDFLARPRLNLNNA